MTAPLLANPWTPYGLRSDPFYQEPVSPADASPDDPHSLFVGRAEEVRRLGSQILGAVSSRALLHGAPGIGKTSVVNRVKAALAEQGCLVHGEPIRVTGALTAGAFGALVLRQLVELHATSALTTSPDPHPLSS